MSFIDVLFLLAAWLAHWWWTTYLSFWGMTPQILLVLTVAIASRKKAVTAMSYGFLWGILWDILSAHLLGANALVLTLTAYAISTLRRQVDVSSFPSQCLLVFLATWAYFILMGIMGFLFIKSFVWPGWPFFLASPFYNCAVAGAIFIAWPVKGKR